MVAEQRVIDPALDRAFRTHFSNQRRRAAGGALAALANVADISAGGTGGYSAQQFFPRLARTPGGLSKKESLMLRAQVIRDMGNYLKGIHGQQLTSLEKLREQGNAANSYANFLGRIITASGSANAATASAKINAMKAMATDMTKGIDLIYPKYQANMVNATYLGLREYVLGTSDDGTLLNESGVSALARKLAGDQLLKQNPQMLSDVYWLLNNEVAENDAYGGRSLTDILQQYAGGGNIAAQRLLGAVSQAQKTSQDLGGRLLQARAKVLANMADEISNVYAGPNLELVKIGAKMYGDLMKGEGGSLKELDQTLEQSAPTVDPSRPMDHYNQLLEELTAGRLPETRDQIMASPGYLALVDQVNQAMAEKYGQDWESRTGRAWRPLDPNDSETFRLINRMRKRENRQRRRDVRDQINFVEFGSKKPKPSKGAQAAGGGLGYEAERGDGGSKGMDLRFETDDARVTMEGGGGIRHERGAEEPGPLTMERLMRMELEAPSGPPAEVPTMTEGLEALLEDGTPAVWLNGEWNTEGPEAQRLGSMLQEVFELDPEVGKTQLARFQKNYLDAQSTIEQQKGVTQARTQIREAAVEQQPPQLTPEQEQIADLTQPTKSLDDLLRARLRRREKRDGGSGARTRP